MNRLTCFRKMFVCLPLLGAAINAAAAVPVADLAQGAIYLREIPAIQLRSFGAALNEDKVDLYWSTASEFNSQYFVVERSKDGELWAELLRAESAGNSTSLIEYADFDPNPLKGVSYYRLRQTDMKGAKVYSQVVVVKNNLKTEAQISPADMTAFGDEEVLVLARDIKGHEFYSKIYLVGKGESVKAVALDHGLAAGAYLVVASSRENLVSRKIIVE